MLPAHLVAEAADLLQLLRGKGLTLATAESCTGGLIAAVLTDVPGSSDVFERGFVTYSNAAKTGMIGVSADLIGRHGAVSEPVARAMAEGALGHSSADVSIAVTGVAGPGGGSVEKPVGLVHIAAAQRGQPTQHRRCDFGDLGRSGIREATVAQAFRLVRSILNS
jgi:nicotinamide-nucleotide amidase